MNGTLCRLLRPYHLYTRSLITLYSIQDTFPMSTEHQNLSVERVELEEVSKPGIAAIHISLETANERKEEGNQFFRAGKWNDALVAYQAALNCVPKRSQAKGKEKSTTDVEGEHVSEPAKEEVVTDISSPAVTDTEKNNSKLRAILNSNIGACYVKLGDHKEAVKFCSEAILDDPAYIKARERRAACNEILGTWTSFTSAQEDYNALLKLHTSPAQINDVQKKLRLLKPKLESAQKRETDEMLNKLKGLGDSILGNFGLSTSNFKFEPNGSGGYSVNFTK